MDQILPPELNDLELEALREIAEHPASHHIPFRVESRLKDIGYAKEVLGDLVLTDDGLRCAASAACGPIATITSGRARTNSAAVVSKEATVTLKPRRST
jgi:hypothetical protein